MSVVEANARATLVVVPGDNAAQHAPMLPLSEYQAHLLARGLSANTVRQRVTFARSRIADWGTLDVPAGVAVAWLLAYSGWTRRTYAAHLRSLYAWMIEAGHLRVSPLAAMRTPRQPPPRPKSLSADELARVMRGASGDLRAWLMLGSLAGLRCHEIAKVRGEDVDAEHVYVNGKGGVEALIPTHPALWALAQSYPRVGYWFPSPQARRQHISESWVGNSVRTHFRAHGISSGATHRLRHTYATTMARGGAQPRIVQELMRHSSLTTTMGYIAVDDAEKRAAIQMLAA